MRKAERAPRGYYFEEFEVGQQIQTGGRTVTEADIVNFAGVSGDFNAIHTDRDFARDTPYGERISHGLLVLSIISGLAVQTGFMEGTILAWREILDWKFSRHVRIGDTVHGVIEVEELKPISRLGGGSVLLKIQVFNQEDTLVMQGRWSVLVLSKPDEEP